MPKFQGQGIMKESAQVIIDFVFQTLKFQKILAVTHCDNQNSTRLLKKLDFIKSMENDKDNPDLFVYFLSKQNS